MGWECNKYGWILDDNHVVIDIDVHDQKANGYESLDKLESEIGFCLSDVCFAIVLSPSGGRHYYFTKPRDAKFGKVFADKYPGIDFISGKGKQVIAANSSHDSHAGEFYRLNEGARLIEMPAALLNHLRELRKTEGAAIPSVGSDALPGERSGDEFNKSQRG